jgi:hypothetical protein
MRNATHAERQLPRWRIAAELMALRYRGHQPITIGRCSDGEPVAGAIIPRISAIRPESGLYLSDNNIYL